MAFIIVNGLESKIEKLLEGRKNNVVIKDFSSISSYINFFEEYKSLDLEDVLIINAELLLTNESKRTEFLGIDLLKWLRYKNRLFNKIVLTGFTELNSLLKERPQDIIALSSGTTYLQLPFKPHELNGAVLNLNDINQDEYNNTIRPFVSIDFNIKDLSHDFSNKLGLNFLAIGYYNLFYENPDNKPNVDFIQKKIFEILNESLELYKSSILYNYNLDPNDNERKLILDFLGKNQRTIATSKILYIDDQSKNGWGEILSLILSNKLNGLEILDLDYEKSTVLQITTSVVNKINEYKPDLVLLDLYLTDKPSENFDTISGIQVLKEIKKHYASLPVIITSATNKSSKMELALKNGAETLWSKPRVEEKGFSIYKSYFSLLNKVYNALTKFKHPIQKRLLEAELKLKSINENSASITENDFVNQFNLILVDTNCWMYNNDLELVSSIYVSLYKTSLLAKNNAFLILDDVELELLDHIQNKGERHNEILSISAKFGLDLIARIQKEKNIKPYVNHLKSDRINRFKFIYSRTNNQSDIVIETCIDSHKKIKPESRVYYDYNNVKKRLESTSNLNYRSSLQRVIDNKDKDYNKLNITNHHRSHADDAFINILYNKIKNNKEPDSKYLFISDDVECRDNIFNLINSRFSLKLKQNPIVNFEKKDKNGVDKIICGNWSGINDRRIEFELLILSPTQYAKVLTNLKE